MIGWWPSRRRGVAVNPLMKRAGAMRSTRSTETAALVDDNASVLGQHLRRVATPDETLHDHERRAAAPGDQVGGHHGLARSGRGDEHADLVSFQRLDGRGLHRTQLADERQRRGIPIDAGVLDHELAACKRKLLTHVAQTTTRNHESPGALLVAG